MARADATFEAVEEMLIEAMGLLRRLPDKERGWLASGSRSCVPDVIRDKQSDYADADAQPRLQLSRREMALVEEVFLAARCLTLEIAPANLALVAMVLQAKGGRMAGGFEWSDIWIRMGGRRLGVTSDALRARYDRSLGRIAVRLAREEDL